MPVNTKEFPRFLGKYTWEFPENLGTVFHFFSQEFLRIPGNFVPINTKESRDFLGNILGNFLGFPGISLNNFARH